jgi:hypothetical protein
MRVGCVELPRAVDDGHLGSRPEVTLDGDYPVLSIRADAGGAVRLLLLDDYRVLGWYDASCFLTIDPVLPPHWGARVHAGGHLDLGPHAWLVDDFWERYHQGEGIAVESVEAEVGRILRVEPS